MLCSNLVFLFLQPATSPAFGLSGLSSTTDFFSLSSPSTGDSSGEPSQLSWKSKELVGESGASDNSESGELGTPDDAAALGPMAGSLSACDSSSLSSHSDSNSFGEPSQLSWKAKELVGESGASDKSESGEPDDSDSVAALGPTAFLRLVCCLDGPTWVADL
jgi:hypothetical protein